MLCGVEGINTEDVSFELGLENVWEGAGVGERCQHRQESGKCSVFGGQGAAQGG